MESNKVFFFRGSIGSALKKMVGFWTVGKKDWTGFGKYPVFPSSKALLGFRGSEKTKHLMWGQNFDGNNDDFQIHRIAWRNASNGVCRLELIHHDVYFCWQFHMRFGWIRDRIPRILLKNKQPQMGII